MNPNLGQDDTIAAIATPAGVGSIGVIRVSGNHAISIVSQVFKGKLQEFESHTVHHGEIIDPSTDYLIDEALVLVMKGPRSYTGEDVVEIQSHGNPALLQKILSVLITCGARLAQPGEFTRRAFLAGKMDLAQAEAVMELIAAQSNAAQAMALNQLRGKLSAKIDSVKEEILSLLSQIEASIDFTEQGIDLCSYGEIVARIDRPYQSICELLSRYEEGKQIREGRSVVIVGRPNVGKSSIMNYLLGEDRAIVTPIPGTTRDTLEERLNLQGHIIKIIDTAGMRDTTDSIEQEGVRRGEGALKRADIALFVLDVSEPIHLEDITLWDKITCKKKIIILNKIDLPSRIYIEAIHTKYPTDPVVLLSAATGEGMDDLKNKLVALIATKEESEPPHISLLRHKNALERAKHAMNRALQLAIEALRGVDFVRPSEGRGGIERETNRPPHWVDEFLAADLREALDALGEIVGKITTDDILDQIFNQFCIVK
ncbi:MAG: tRNA uridine-5-carboxymethylaminomethyl(34) synthesis GTPase MnmE [Nitrospirae bacterium]|nr:tRNA uridine-5-carboxymethylaminomethyl(34) synthesis GTPase MnmE [Candidatus Troglogloeales bacterium]